MIRLKSLLLAGTLVPALALIPLAPVAAQSGDPGAGHGPHPHEGGGKGEGKGEGRGHPKGERAEGGERRQGGPGRERAQKGDDRPDAGGKKAAGGEPHGRERAQNREDRPDAAGGRGKGAGGEPHGRERAQNREDRPDAAAGKGAGGEPPARQRAQTREGRPDTPRGGERGPGDRMKAGEPARGNDARQADEPGRRLGTEERRDERKLGNEERRDQRKLGNEERQDQRRLGNEEPRGAPGPAVGFAGGFMAPTGARRIDDLRRDRREVREGDRTFIREPGRTIVQERGRAFIVHDENDRFRALGLDVRRERRGDQFVDTVRRPNGDVIITITDANGRLLRRLRRDPGGREFVLIDNGVGGRVLALADDVVVLPPPPMRIPRERYIVDYGAANAGLIYETLIAPPLAPPPQRYTLDQIRYSPDIRSYVRQVDINTINFDTGSWDVPHSADAKLEALASGMKRAIERNPNSVFLIEGYTDATGNPNDNLSLSDRRAQSVAEILTKDFGVAPENLTTQGYGQQNLKENTSGPSAVNRRVVVQNITQLLASGGAPAGH